MKKKKAILALSLLASVSLIITAVAAINDYTNGKAIVQEQAVRFSDVNVSDWFYGDVQYVQKNKLMNGISETEFAPSDITTRGMIVTILWRLEDEPIEQGAHFEDVTKEAYYHNAVSWASKNQIVNGYDKKTFGPNDVATREQFATIMYRYAVFKKLDTSNVTSLDKYSDKGQISEYAIKSIQWANANGLITGTSDTTISPQDDVTRCQVAAILRRFCERFNLLSDKSVIESDNTIGDNIDGQTTNDKKGNSGSRDFVGGENVGAEDGPDESSTDNKEELPEAMKGVDEEHRPTIKVNTTYGNSGENITVPVEIYNNPGILGMVLQLEYDEEAMTLVNVENGDAISDVLDLTTSKELNSGVKFVWDGLEIHPNQVKDGTILMLEFKLSDNAVLGKRYPLSFEFKPGEIIDNDLQTIDITVNQGFVEIDQEK